MRAALTGQPLSGFRFCVFDKAEYTRFEKPNTHKLARIR